MEVRAAIDLGSNSVKLLVLELDEQGGYDIMWDEARVTRLGRDLGAGGRLDRRSEEDTLNCVRDFAKRAQALGATELRVAGTAALRRAANAEEFIARAHYELEVFDLRHTVEVLSVEQEARLARVVALRELPAGAADVVYFDVGGNSTELAWCRGEDVLSECYLDLGARRCTEQAGVVHPVNPLMEERLAAMIQTALKDAPCPSGAGPGAVQAPPRLVGVGGTATSMVWLLQGLRGEGIGNPHLAEVELAEAQKLQAHMANRSPREMCALRNLDPARADVIYAGVAVVAGILRHYGAERFTLLERGLRFGLLLA